ncbi:MAG: DsbC family protein [Syntrophales bacterium]
MRAAKTPPGQTLAGRKDAGRRRVFWAFLGLVLTVLPAYAVTPEEALRKDFPELKFDRIGPSPVPGMAEVIVGPDILYYHPREGVIMTGEMISRELKNLTRQRKGELQAEQIKTLPLDLAVRIGTGSHRVIEFTDPNCPYCRQASKYLKDRMDLSRYIFFFPLSPRSEDKIRYVLCAPDRGKAYEDVMAGRRDGVEPEICKNSQAGEIQKRHRDLGQRLGLEGTPFFVIDGEVVAGADLPRMEKLLEAKRP